jgi:hypothetical protein
VGGGGGSRRVPASDPGGLDPENPGEVGGAKAVEDRLGQVWRRDLVTGVTTALGLLRAAREALAEGESGRADRVLAEGIRRLQLVASSAGEDAGGPD